MPRRLPVLAAAAVLVASLVTTSPARAAGGYAAPVLIGDSIGHGVAAQFRATRPDFVVDAVPGRRVVTLPVRLRRYLATYGVPRRLVIELGTNTVAGWTEADYQAVVEMVPRTTTIVMVTPYVRANDLSAALPRGRSAARRPARYTRWEWEIAASNSNVCIADWRATVIADQGLLTAGGVHPDARGKQVLVRLIDQALASCG